MRQPIIRGAAVCVTVFASTVILSGGAAAGPAGSDQIEKVFESYYTIIGQPFKGTDFSGRSDYGPFILAGIPSGGLFTGAEGIKTAAEAASRDGIAG